jgi:hypothetical protein
LSINGNIGPFLWVGEKPSVVAAEEEKEMAKYLGDSLREDEFFDGGFHQLH